MSPLNLSPSRDSSSNSTTPPSEATLSEDPLPGLFDQGIPVPRRQTPISYSDQRTLSELNHRGSQQNRIVNVNYLNSDYESSAAEDVDLYTTTKYQNAEFALLSYSRTNKTEKLNRLLEAKLNEELVLNLNYKGEQKQNFSWSALHLACYFGHIKIVEMLLSEKKFRDEIDINIQNNLGDTPLHKAALTNRIGIVQFLLANGADIYILNSDGLLARQLTTDTHVFKMLQAAEQVEKMRFRQEMFKAVDCGDLKKLQELFDELSSRVEVNSKEFAAIETESDQLRHQDKGNTNNTPGKFAEQLTDDRGNTLLHIAAMRGDNGICVYLLEHGFDPYKKNNSSQTCIDLSTYQLRQLFATVKPTDSQLRKFSKQRVSRFEGPLLKKVRILGWKQMYVVLENGVILLFNNRRDSMNKSRRGYKYLESATCIAEPNDFGVFTICFSDKSRATFSIAAEHLSSYPTFGSQIADKSQPTSANIIDLVRQKWIDSIRDHIQYSTNFIRNGLSFNDCDENDDSCNNAGDLASLNHLLPIDTIKSFISEARAHYSILERHADSLCNLVQSITTSNRINNQADVAREDPAQVAESQVSSVNPTTSGSRLLGLIRPSRSTRNNSTSVDDNHSQTIHHESFRNRNNSLTNEFVQDNWHCILFHLRLLTESTQNTKSSMNQALALMEHQEHLRQNRIQHQEERCRVLEDSLHALARDHHELEKSLSMSQIYQSARSISMSMSTDLNEYFDAFEDFDDEKTVTPNSMPSDEDIHQKIQDVMNDDDGLMMAMQPRAPEQYNAEHKVPDENTDYEDEEDEDLRSNCSALTVETVSEQPFSSLDRRGCLDTINMDTNDPLYGATNNSRTRLPSPMVPRDQVSIWSILKDCIGQELSKITMPVIFNEPLTMLQRACEGVQYSHYLKMADLSDDPVERMELVCTFIIAGLSCNCQRIIKPFNPLLYETYEFTHELGDGTEVKAMAQQVSHHPPITAVYSESDNFTYNGSVNPKLKFWGRSVVVQPDGHCEIYLKRHKETYSFKTVSCSIHNIIVGKLWFEHSGPLDVKCVESKLEANLNFKPVGWFNNDIHRFEGTIVSTSKSSSDKKKLRFIYGKWSHYINSVNYSDYEKYIDENQIKRFRIPDTQNQSNGLLERLDSLSLSGSPKSTNNNSITNDNSQNSVSRSSKPKTSKGGDKESTNSKSDAIQASHIPNARNLWKLESQYLEEYYNFTLFTMKLNEIEPDIAARLPRTDSRFRPDVRKLEEGDLDGAASEKQRLEEKQRAARARDKRFKDPSPDLLWFKFDKTDHLKEKSWQYSGGYWENKCNLERFPDLF